MQKVVSHWLESQHSSPTSFVPTRKKKFSKTVKLAFTSGKGGVGKTSITLKTGIELSNLGYKVLVIDCDFNLSNTAIKLGLPLKNTFYDYLNHDAPLESCLSFYGNMHLISACNGSLGLYQSDIKVEDHILDIIHEFDKKYDFIILDCPAGLTRDNLFLNAYVDHRVFVVTPDQSSITDSYSFMKILAREFDITSNHLFVNKYVEKRQFQKVVKTISETAENFLNCRTSIFGSMKLLDIKADHFDREFLDRKNTPLNKSFVNNLSHFAEKVIGGFNHLTKSEIELREPEVLTGSF